MLKLYSVALVLVTVSFCSAIPSPDKWKQFKRPDFKWSVYKYDVMEDGEKQSRQAVSTINDDKLMILTMGETMFSVSSETHINYKTMEAVLVPERWGPCYYHKFADSAVIENMEKWTKDGQLDITNGPVLQLDGTGPRVEGEEWEEMINNEPYMYMRCLSKGVVKTTPLEDGQTAEEGQRMEEIVSYGGKVNLLVPDVDHSEPAWFRRILNEKKKEWEKKKGSFGQKGGNPAKRVKDAIKNALKKKGDNSGDKKPAGVAGKIKNILGNLKKKFGKQ